MGNFLTFFLLAWIGSLLLDATIRPRRKLGWAPLGLLLHGLVLTAQFGLFLAGSGSEPVSAVLALAVMALLTTVSNAKYAMLGEPLVFADLALILAIFRHPRFYLTAVPAKQRWAFMIGGPVLLLVLAILFVPRWPPHLGGFAVLAVGVTGLILVMRVPIPPTVAAETDEQADLARYGLVATLFLYWRRWRETVNPPACPAMPFRAGDEVPDVVVIVQCESFADPRDLVGGAGNALPGLAAAQALAWQWGDLRVSGFGAYTMRTEYGVLFGRSEADLGFRRYDPFLTALGETSYALTARLRNHGYRRLFVHPHDMRFYGRDRLMPAAGFDQLIGEECFDPIPAGGHRYMNDRALGRSIGKLIDNTSGRTFIYAVTMENHGPWDEDASIGASSILRSYFDHLAGSDGLLSDLIGRLSLGDRSGLLVFFGDHRPSIPGVVEPGGARHTPYVMIRFDGDGSILTGDNRRVDLSPDQLHHAILDSVQNSSVVRKAQNAGMVAINLTESEI